MGRKEGPLIVNVADHFTSGPRAQRPPNAQLNFISNKLDGSVSKEHVDPSEVITAANGVHAMTDITGFSLMGHGRELALGSGMTLEIIVDQVPRIEGALDAIHLGAIPAGLLANREFAECLSADAPGSKIPYDLRTLLYDPQTAGGLLISVAPEKADEVLGSLQSTGLGAASIGSVPGPYAGRGTPAILLR